MSLFFSSLLFLIIVILFLKGVGGSIEYIHEPHGGIVDCGGTRVYFHRSRVFIQVILILIISHLPSYYELKNPKDFIV